MTAPQPSATAPIHIPRVAITYCTQCKWSLRANYFSQELQSTFGTSLGEVAVIPATGGLFTVHLTYRQGDGSGEAEVKEVLLWDRKAEGGFPETKVLKQLVRNCIEPGKDLGHSDKPSNKARARVEGEREGGRQGTEAEVDEKASKEGCEDCK